MRYVMVFNDCQDWFEVSSEDPIEIWAIEEGEFRKLDSGNRPTGIDQVAVWQLLVDEEGETVRLVNEQEQANVATL